MIGIYIHDNQDYALLLASHPFESFPHSLRRNLLNIDMAENLWVLTPPMKVQAFSLSTNFNFGLLLLARPRGIMTWGYYRTIQSTPRSIYYLQL